MRDGRREGRRLRYCSPRCNSAGWYRANVDLVLQRTRAHYAANREWYQAYARAWFPNNRDKQRVSARKYLANNLNLVRAKNRERRVLERQLRPLFDELITACMGPLHHLVADFTDEHLDELRSLLLVDLERDFSALQQSVH